MRVKFSELHCISLSNLRKEHFSGNLLSEMSQLCVTSMATDDVTDAVMHTFKAVLGG